MIKIKNFLDLLLLTIAIIFICCLALLIKKKNPAPQCHANIRYSTIHNGQALKSNMTVEIYFKAGYASIMGDVQLGDNLYSVKKDIYLKKEEQSGTVVLDKEITLPGDNFDNVLWERILIPRPYKTPFFSHVEKLMGTLYYIRVSSSPYFICAGSN